MTDAPLQDSLFLLGQALWKFRTLEHDGLITPGQADDLAAAAVHAWLDGQRADKVRLEAVA